MNHNDQAWLENRIAAAVADDFYLDRLEEKSIKEEGTARGFPIADVELILRTVMDQYGAVSERQLVDELDQWLHQKTDQDQRLDETEERDALSHVVLAKNGKKKGLDPVVAEEYVSNFCKAHGVTRDSDKTGRGHRFARFGLGLLAILVVGSALFLFLGKPSNVVQEPTSVAGGAVLPVSEVRLSAEDRADIDDQLRRAVAYVQASQFTDPPEKSAKACLDTIKRIDPAGSYRGAEVRGLVTDIVSQYMVLADRAASQKDKAGVRKWIERAKLFNADSEVIRDKEVTLGLLSGNER